MLKITYFQNFLKVNWTNKYLKINLNAIYLAPCAVHHWAISLESLKLNLVKFFIWSNSLNSTFIGIDAVLDLFNVGSTNPNAKKPNANPANEPNKFEAKQPLYNFFSTLYVSKSNIHLLCKLIQIFTGVFTNLIDEKLKLDDENLNFIDIVIESVLLEIKWNRKKMTKCTWSSGMNF